MKSTSRFTTVGSSLSSVRLKSSPKSSSHQAFFRFTASESGPAGSAICRGELAGATPGADAGAACAAAAGAAGADIGGVDTGGVTTGGVATGGVTTGCVTGGGTGELYTNNSN